MKTPPQFQHIDDNTNFIIFNVWLASACASGASGSWWFTGLALVMAACYVVNQILLSNERNRNHTTNNP